MTDVIAALGLLPVEDQIPTVKEVVAKLARGDQACAERRQKPSQGI